MTEPRARWEFSPQVERRLKHWRIGLLTFNIVAVTLGLVFVNYPILTVERVTIDGPSDWYDQALAVVAPVGDSNIFRYDVRRATEKLTEQFGARADCRVRLVLPNQISVRLTPAKAVLWTEWGDGVRGDGAVFKERADMPSAPVWRTVSRRAAVDGASAPSCIAAGTWAEIVKADERFAAGVSEWCRDERDGWVMMAADGRTRVLLGWNNLEERAALVARVLEHRDSTITDGSMIDARFDGCVLVRPVRKTAAAASTLRNRHSSTPTMAARRSVANNRRGG